MSFDTPLWLLSLPVMLAGMWVSHAWGSSGVSKRQRMWAVGVRTVIIFSLVLALAGLRTGGLGDRVAVVFLVDRSDSISAADDERAERFIEAAVEAKARGDQTAVVAFGKEPRLEFTMTERPAITRFTAAPDGSATDLARALRLAGALFPEGARRRIVVFTDGRETSGDARREAARLAREGIAIEGLTLGGATGNDSLIESLDLPGRVRLGESFDVGVTVRSPGGPAHLEIVRDGQRIYDKDVTLRAGRSTITVGEKASGDGLRRYAATLRSPTDVVPQNDRAAGAVIVQGPPRVLIVEQVPGEANTLVRALDAARVPVDRIKPSRLPDLAKLLEYSATVLVDVPGDALANEAVGTLGTAVRDAGMGLVTIGGEDSYGLGGYRGSPLEALLPLESDIKDPKRRPSVSQALVIDTSGSMGACHCAGGAMNGGAEESGVNKTDISRAGAARAIGALGKDDTVGVLAFNTTSKWILDLQKVPTDEVVEEHLQKMTPSGGTNIDQALRTAVESLKQQKTKLKHIILFTDGWTDKSSLIALAKQISDQGITLSVVATGEGTAEVLAKMATAGRGRFYAGTNIQDVPQVMMQEAILASRNFVNEGLFTPVITANTPITERLTNAPALLGYVATTPKSTATVDLQVGQEDPLLATWRAGLGTVVSWTSDAKARWARPWVGWEGFRDFWATTIRSTFSSVPTGAYALEATTTSDRLTVTIEAREPLPAGTTATARIVSPTLRSTELELERTGATEFQGSVRAGEEGTYLIAVTVRQNGTITYSDRITTTRAYSAEYLDAEPDPTLMTDLIAATKGRKTVTTANAFAAAGLKPSPARHERWPLLALIALLLIPVDIGLRRLTVTREDLRRARAAFSERRSARPPTPEREEAVSRLFEAKERIRKRYD